MYRTTLSWILIHYIYICVLFHFFEVWEFFIFLVFSHLPTLRLFLFSVVDEFHIDPDLSYFYYQITILLRISRHVTYFDSMYSLRDRSLPVQLFFSCEQTSSSES